MGNGLKIKVGIDPIVGHNSLYFLFEELRDYLTDLGITYLAQAQNLEVVGTDGPYWYSTSDLLLGGDWAAQWSSYVKGLTHGGIRIGHAEDKLLWIYDEQMGKVTAKKAYDLIVCNHRTIMENDIILKIWHFNIPHKLKCLTGSLVIRKLILRIVSARRAGTVLIGAVYSMRRLNLWIIFLLAVFL